MWDPRGRLAAVVDPATGALLEAYAHDAHGRLAAVLRPGGQREEMVHERFLVVGHLGLVARRRARHAQHLASTSLRDIEHAAHVLDGLSLASAAQYFPSSASFKIALSNLSSATRLLRRVFSRSRSLSRLTSSPPMAP